MRPYIARMVRSAVVKSLQFQKTGRFTAEEVLDMNARAIEGSFHTWYRCKPRRS